MTVFGYLALRSPYRIYNTNTGRCRRRTKALSEPTGTRRIGVKNNWPLKVPFSNGRINARSNASE
jgi:hypothetical protein